MRSGGLLAAALAFGATGALAQGMPPGGMPTNEEIRQRIEEGIARVVEAAPEAEVEIEGIVKITYKQIPTNPEEVAELLGQELGQGGQVPQGVDVDQMLNMYQGQITEVLNEHMRHLGTFEALVDLKVKSKDIPTGEWEFGIEFDGERPIALVIRGEDLPRRGRPIPIRLKTRGVDMQDRLTLELDEPDEQEEGEEEFDIVLAFLRFMAKTKSEIERD